MRNKIKLEWTDVLINTKNRIWYDMMGQQLKQLIMSNKLVWS